MDPTRHPGDTTSEISSAEQSVPRPSRSLQRSSADRAEAQRKRRYVLARACFRVVILR